jgi:hypothetical protein
MKPNFPVAALCLLASSLACPGDTFTLKDGSVLEGKVLSEDAESYHLEIQVTKTIKDERSVPKADVLKIDREQPDLTAFQEIEKLVPTPDLLSPADYLQRIAQIGKFLKTHPDSSKVKQANVILESLKSEAAQITAGGVKVNGEILSPAAYKLNAFELDARVQEARIRDLIARGDHLAALRAFSEFDREYRTTLPYGSLAPMMRQLVQMHVGEAKEQLATLPDRLKARQTGLERMTMEDRQVSARAIAEEEQANEARFKAEKEAKISWVSTSPFHKPSLEETVRFGTAELARLEAVKPVLGVDGGRAFRDAWRVILGGADTTAIAAAIGEARSASVAPRYIAMLEAAAKNQ